MPLQQYKLDLIFNIILQCITLGTYSEISMGFDAAVYNSQWVACCLWQQFKPYMIVSFRYLPNAFE